MRPEVRTRSVKAALCIGAVKVAYALIALGCMTMTAPAQAAPILGILDYQGFVYESAPVGSPGSQLGGVGTVDAWFFPYHDPAMVYTWSMAGLVGLSGMDVGGGTTRVEYTGGTFSIFEDTVDDGIYDAAPGNGLADPVGFDDGTPWLICRFADFELYWNAGAGLGSFSGNLVITGGSAAWAFAQSTAYTFAGQTDQTGRPEGYPRKVDGALEGPLVPEPSSIMLMGLPLAGWLGLRLRRGTRASRP